MKYWSIFLIFSLFSCQYFGKKEERKVILDYKGQKLYEDELAKVLPETYTAEDSINIVEPFIKKWLHKKITVANAISEIPPEEIYELDQHIIQYRDDLILNKFYNKRLNDINENAITDQQMIDYFHKNERSFVLNEDLVKIQYIIAPIQFKEQLLENVASSDTLKNICEKYEDIECFSTDKWLNFQQTLSSFNLDEKDNSMDILRQNPLMKLEKDGKFYLIKWTDFLSKGEIGPYEYFKNTIHSILINKRKLNLQKQIEDSLYDDAIQNDKIKFYE